jgi:hypothetical protein
MIPLNSEVIIISIKNREFRWEIEEGKRTIYYNEHDCQVNELKY